MSTAANLLVILIFLAAIYTFLGLLCGIAEKALELWARPYQRRRVRRGTRRRTPRRGAATLNGESRAQRLHGAATKEKAVSTGQPAPRVAAATFR